VTLEADGKIVAAGFAAAASGGKFALARFNADGSLDDTFGGDGGVTTNLSTRHDAATAVAIQSDVRPVRYNAGGTLDSKFGTTDGLRQTSPRTRTSPPGSHSRQTE
jgi:serralysin